MRRKVIPEEMQMQKGRKASESVRKRTNQYICIYVERLNAITAPSIYYKIASEQ